MPASPPFDPSALASHAGWLRALARGLVHDDALADDLVQDTWVAALRHPPDGDRPLRPWLVHVLRNAARFRWRGEARRVAREQAAMISGDGAAPSSEALLERLQAQRVLARLVAELDEPFRAAVLACYAEGATPSELARQLGVPAGTVRWRLQEARARLRQALLDEHGGDARPARAVLAPLLVVIPRRPTWLLPAAALLALALLAIVLLTTIDRGGRARDASASGSSTATRPVIAARAPSSDDDRLAALAAAHPPGWLAQDGVAPRRVAGRVVIDGAPVAGATVRLTSELSLAGVTAVRERVTGADGRFDLGTHVARAIVVSAAVPGHQAAIQHVELRDQRVAADRLELEPTACVARYHGRVLDAGGGGVEHAELLREGAIGAVSDRDGGYALCLPPTAATADELRVIVHADGYGAISIDAAPAGDTRRDLVLVPEAIVVGRVTTVSGAAVADARVWLEPERGLVPSGEGPAARAAVTDRDGQFRVDGVSTGRFQVTARARDGISMTVAVTATAGASHEVALVVGGAGVVRGLVTRGGAPLAGARVRVVELDGVDAVTQADGRFVLDHVPRSGARLEVVAHRVVTAGGAATLYGRGGLVVVTVDADTSVELAVATLGALYGQVTRAEVGVPYARVTCGGVAHVTTTADRDGRYRLEGLWPGDYRCYADDRRLDAFVEDVAVALAEGEERALPLALHGARISGRVVDGTGVGVPEVHVVFRRADGDRGRCSTDRTGAFTCAAMLGDGAYLAAVHASADGAVAFPWLGPAPGPFALVDRDAALTDVVLAIDPRRVALRGRVVDVDGAPVADARVRATAIDGPRDAAPPVGVTAVDGSFAIDGLAPGRYAAEVHSADGLRRARDEVTAGAAPVTLVVAAATCARADVVVAAPPSSTVRPSAPIVWGDRVELIGHVAPTTAARGDTIEVTAYYRARAPLERAWRMFVHVDGDDWRINADHEPAGGRCPTSTWSPGELVVDRFTIPIRANVPPGSYAIWVGFYSGWAPDWVNLDVSAAPIAARDRHRIRLADLVIR